jgi:uncharacterized phiE125 gp8 family phage protein
MRLVSVTPPSGDLIPINELRAYLRVDSSADAEVEEMTREVVQHLDGRDGYLGRALLTQTWEARLDDFPGEERIELPLPPLQSVGSITYTDPEGAEQTFAAANFGLYGVGGRAPGGVYLKPDARWPRTLDVPEAVRIEFTSGYGAGADVPAPIRSAVKMLVAAAYEQREAYSVDYEIHTNPALMDRLGPFVVYR